MIPAVYVAYVHTQFSCPDVIALAEALAENTNMLRVELRNNAIGAAGLLALW